MTPSRADDNAALEITLEQVGSVDIGCVSLRNHRSFHGMRKDVLDLLRRIGPTILRWPGGNFALDYRWMEGLLPVHKRPAICDSDHKTLAHTNGYDTHEIGINEFILLCRELNCEPFVTVNINLDGPQEASAFVEYCNGSTSTTWGAERQKGAFQTRSK